MPKFSQKYRKKAKTFSKTVSTPQCEVWLEEQLQEDIFFGYNSDVRPLDMGSIITWNIT